MENKHRTMRVAYKMRAHAPERHVIYEPAAPLRDYQHIGLLFFRRVEYHLPCVAGGQYGIDFETLPAYVLGRRLQELPSLGLPLLVYILVLHARVMRKLDNGQEHHLGLDPLKKLQGLIKSLLRIFGAVVTKQYFHLIPP